MVKLSLLTQVDAQSLDVTRHHMVTSLMRLRPLACRLMATLARRTMAETPRQANGPAV